MTNVKTTKANTSKRNIKLASKAKPKAQATVTSGEAKAVAQANVNAAAEHYKALNAAFLSKYNKRPIFGEKRPTPIDLEKHNPASATDRDNAFIHAIRTVYGEKPFTTADIKCDTGNIARAIKLGMLQSLGTVDGNEQFKAVIAKA